RDVRDVTRELTERRQKIFAATVKSLAAAAEASTAAGEIDVSELARQHRVDVDALNAWLNYLGIGSGGPVKIDSWFTNTFKTASGYDFIKGWNNADLPNLVANSPDLHVGIPA